MENFEWSLLLQFPKFCKTWKINSRPYLIPTTPRIGLLLSENTVALLYENVILPRIQVLPKNKLSDLN